MPRRLSQLLSEQNLDVAYWAATLLGRLGADKADACAGAVKPLADALQSHPAPAVQERAAWALGQIGPRPPSAKPALEAAANSSSPRLSRLAKESLEKIKSG